MWGETCRRATILLDIALVSVVYITYSRSRGYDGHRTERIMRYGTVLYVAVVLLCAILWRRGIVVDL